MSVNLSMLAGAGWQFFDNNGVILSGGLVYTYAAGTTTPQAAYTTSSGSTAHTNPIVLDSAGRVASGGEIWLTDAVAYKFVLKTATGTTIGTYDNVTGNSSGIYAAFAASSGSSLVGYLAAGTGAVSTTVQAKLRAWVSPEDFGAVANGVTNDYQAIQNAIDYLVSIGGGTVICKNGATYATNPAPAIKNNVTVDMRGATWNMTLGSGNVYGVRIGTNSGIQNGVLHAISTGTPSSQLMFHSAISIGEPNNAGFTPANPGYYQSANNWFVQNMTIDTTRPNGVALQGMGSIYNGIVENVIVPSNALCSGIHFDWGNVGTVSSGSIPATRTAYDAGECYTTHPNNIIIRNLTVGDLSYPLAAPDLGTRAVRLSACYGITIENVKVGGTTYAAFNHVGGDLGFEFAQADVRLFACRGTSVKNFQADNSGQWGAYIDTYADNIAGAVSSGYAPIFDVLMQGDITLDQFTTVGLGLNTNEDGIRLEFVKGVYVKDAICFNHNHGMYIDQSAQNIKVEKGNYYYNQRDGIAIRDNVDTRYINIDSVVAQRNGLYASASIPSGIKVSGGTSINVQNCFLGSTSEDYQVTGLFVDAAAVHVKIVNNTVLEVVAGGFAFDISDDGVYTAVDIFNGNVYNGTVGTAYTGQRIYPIAREYDPASQNFVGVWFASKSFLSADTTPPSGTWKTGDRILYSGGSVANSYTGTICITGGTPGTWKRFGATEP